MLEPEVYSLIVEQNDIREAAYSYLYGGVLLGAVTSALGLCYRPSTPVRKFGKLLVCAHGLMFATASTTMGIGALRASPHVTVDAGAETAMGPVLVSISAPKATPLSDNTVRIERSFHLVPNWAFWRRKSS